MAILSFRLSNLPGNEQREMWGSQSANINGSYNVMGVKNKAIDAIIDGLINSTNKENYEAYVKALDRVIMHEYYFIPQWYSPVERIAYHNKLKHYNTNIKTGIDIYSWWIED